MRLLQIILILSVVVCCTVNESKAQTPPPVKAQKQSEQDTVGTGKTKPDSTSVARHRALRVSPQERTGFFQSPTGTLLKSVAFPGWGQWSNGKKSKAAVYFAVESYFFSRSLIWYGRTADRQQVWQQSCATGNCDDQAFMSFDNARNRRNYFYWLTGVTIFISMFDAYADRYLLTLEQTRNKGDDFWGGQAALSPADEVRLVARWRF